MSKAKLLNVPTTEEKDKHKKLEGSGILMVVSADRLLLMEVPQPRNEIYSTPASCCLRLERVNDANGNESRLSS